MSGDPSDLILKLAERQVSIYRGQPAELMSHYNHECSVVESYRGRQLLELLQNADDAFDPRKRPSQLLFQLTPDCLIAANSGQPFTYEGIESLVISDASPKQLHRTRCIGNKGLGFRSVLSWSSAPLVLSGNWSIAFSADHARAQVEALAQKDAGVGAKVQKWRAARTDLPAPVMRFPFVPSEDDPRLVAARRLAAKGFDTVVVLPLLPTPSLERVRGEVLAQFADIAGETLLFCYHLEELRIEASEGSFLAEWQLTRSEDGGREKVLVARQGVSPRGWTIHRRQGELPASLVDAPSRDATGWETAVAVPEDDVDPSQAKLCVFFPTDEVLPMRMLAHATLETNDSRKRLNDHQANRFVLTQLAELMAEIAEGEARSNPARGLRPMAGCESCDPELTKLGFREAVLAACRQRRLFPRLDRQMVSASEVRIAGHPVWAEIATPIRFPELLWVPAEAISQELLAAVNLERYTERELAERIQGHARKLSAQESGELLGRLLAANQVPKGRSQRTGTVELKGNELAAARVRGTRYYLYRVYCDPADETHRELAVLGHPLNSPQATIVETATFRLDEGSGASWYAVEMRADNASPEA